MAEGAADGEEKQAQGVLDALVTIMCKEVAFELHREIMTGGMDFERLYVPTSAEQLAQAKAAGEVKSSNTDIYGNIPSKEPAAPLVCLICSRPLSALRYAPHLDKCMLQGGRNCTRNSGSSGSRSSGRQLPPPPSSSNSSGAVSPAPSPVITPRQASASAAVTAATTVASPRSSAPKRPSIRSVIPMAGGVIGRPWKSILPSADPSKPGSTSSSGGGGSGRKRKALKIVISLHEGEPVQTYQRVLYTGKH
ncbi:unnamed protein product [Chrysoparadoxa australica]